MSQFQIFTAAQIQSLREGGKILQECLRHVASQVRAGVMTKELDLIAEEFILSRGGLPAFKGYHGFPATLCISVNEECVHGIPGKRVLQDGDIVALDGGVLFDDLYTDACISVAVGSIPANVQNFLDATAEALERGCSVVHPGAHIGDISSAIQTYVEGRGYSCVRALTGHGLGDTLHQFPDIPNVGEAGMGPKIPVGTIIAIEPITSMGAGHIEEADDGWTIRTADHSLSAHFEHTILVTEDGYEVLA